MEHDLRANALRLSRGKTATHFPDHAPFLLRHNQLYPLILRSVAKRCVSKDEARNGHQGLMVRDGANAPPHHEELLTQ